VAKPKFYVVWTGHNPGVYTSWESAKKQVDGVPGAQYKSFASREEAEQAFRGNYWSYAGKGDKPAKKAPKDIGDTRILADSLAVDAACSGNPGDMEYRGVHVATGRELFRVGPLPDGTNNIGEFLAIVHALALLQKEGKPNMPIYTDSRNAMLWIKAKTCRTKLARTGRNAPIFDLIRRAESWLAINKVTNPILKWETSVWGEIPADFGRK